MWAGEPKSFGIKLRSRPKGKACTEKEGKRRRKGKSGSFPGSSRGGGGPLAKELRFSFSSAANEFPSGGPEPNLLKDEMTFDSWAICLPRWIMKSRADFAWHLRRSFACDFSTPQTSALSTTAFPLPLSALSSKGHGLSGLSRRRFLKLCRARVLHVFALNYMYLGRYPTLEELGRRPTALQFDIIARLRSLVAVCGSSREPFAIAPGRSGPKLGADILQLEKFMHECGAFQSGYLEGNVSFKDDPELLTAEEYPQLAPYRSLDAARLKLVGEGKWPMESFIDSTLWLPFLEPSFLRHGLPVDESCGPNFAFESRSECLKLVKVWDRNGLLKLFDRPAAEGLFCRVFNCFKSLEHDRQIGDRRRVNMAEMSYDGPSKHLPPGPLLCQMSCKKFKEKVVASVTDRRDFYHQARVSKERAQTNVLPFRFSRQELAETKALHEFDNEAKAKLVKDREIVGDHLAGERFAGAGEGQSSFFAGFASLFQGDHLGVEFALAAHQSLLEQADLLREHEQIRGHCIFPKGPRYSGLIIDDFS